MKSGTIFDNIFVGDDPEEAKTFAAETWGESKEGEKKMKEKQDEEERKKVEEEEKKRKEEGEETIQSRSLTGFKVHLAKTSLACQFVHYIATNVFLIGPLIALVMHAACTLL